MKTTKEYLGIINSAIEKFELPSRPERLYQPIIYALHGGGKRIRPVLMLSATEASGADPQKAVAAALAVEMFHNFTLVHDDMMDRSALRRGRPTVYKKWNESTAILSGDAMLTLAHRLLSDMGTEINALFDESAMKVYEGQQYDMDFEERDDVTAEEYMRMIGLKTASLLACAASMGALIAGRHDAAIAMYDYGYNLGIAFQLQDDYLDTFGTESTFGKPIGGDIVNRKKTWLLINAMEQKREKVDSIYSTAYSPEDLIRKVKSLYYELGLDEQCMELIGCFTALAERALAKTGFDEEAIEFFRSLARKLVKRNK